MCECVNVPDENEKCENVCFREQVNEQEKLNGVCERGETVCERHSKTVV